MPNDSVLEVCENLWNALKSLRDHASDCRVWCDAVCIEQTSDAERNHQVKFMAELYRNANIVVVWLSETGVDFDLVRACVGNLGRGITSACQSHNGDKHTESLINILSVRYWTRKWVCRSETMVTNRNWICKSKVNEVHIIEEIVRARTAVFQNVWGELPTTDFESLVDRLSDTVPPCLRMQSRAVFTARTTSVCRTTERSVTD